MRLILGWLLTLWRSIAKNKEVAQRRRRKIRSRASTLRCIVRPPPSIPPPQSHTASWQSDDKDDHFSQLGEILRFWDLLYQSHNLTWTNVNISWQTLSKAEFWGEKTDNNFWQLGEGKVWRKHPGYFGWNSLKERYYLNARIFWLKFVEGKVLCVRMQTVYFVLPRSWRIGDQAVQTSFCSAFKLKSNSLIWLDAGRWTFSLF